MFARGDNFRGHFTRSFSLRPWKCPRFLFCSCAATIILYRIWTISSTFISPMVWDLVYLWDQKQVTSFRHALATITSSYRTCLHNMNDVYIDNFFQTCFDLRSSRFNDVNECSCSRKLALQVITGDEKAQHSYPIIKFCTVVVSRNCRLTTFRIEPLTCHRRNLHIWCHYFCPIQNKG
jgi:hypothetical protein